MTEERFGFEVQDCRDRHVSHFWVVTGLGAAWHCAHALEGAGVAFRARSLERHCPVTFTGSSVEYHTQEGE